MKQELFIGKQNNPIYFKCLIIITLKRYHRRFIEVANSFYISKLNNKERESVFSNVVDFFNETWKYKPKPFKYNKYVAKKKKLDSENAEEIRETSVQKTVYNDKDGNLIYNKRKLTELPSFIAQLTSNLSLPLACEHIYFNYDFLTGMFNCINHEDIMGNLQRIGESSSYSLNEDARQAFEEIKLFKLIFLQCVFVIKDHPDSTSLQLTSRSLVFYGHFNYFTRLIDQSDANSSISCALIAPYQFMPPPGSDLIFTLEKHFKPIVCTSIGGSNDSYVFTLSDKVVAFNMSNLTDLANFKLEYTDKELCHMVVYSLEDLSEENILLKDFKGGFIVSSDDEILSYSFELTLLFKKKLTNELIKDIFIINSINFLVSFQDKKYFDVYNLTTGELVLREHFDKTIQFLAVNTHHELINITTYLANVPVFIAVVFESTEMKIFEVKGKKEATNIDESNFTIKLTYNVPAAGFDCYSIKFDQLIKLYEFENLVLTLNDGSIVRISFTFFDLATVEDFSMTKNITFIKPLVKKELKFRIGHNLNEKFGFIGSNNYGYLLENETLFEIPGTFDKITILDEKSLLLFDNGTIKKYYFMANLKEKNYKMAQLMQIDAHCDKINFCFVKDSMLLTTSLDSAMKCFLIKGASSSIKKTNLNLDMNEKSVEKIVYCNKDDLVITMMETTK